MKMARFRRALTIGVVVTALTVGPAAILTGAADHLDAPGLTPPSGDLRTDITDIYAFRSPSDSSNAVLIMDVNPAAGVFGGTTFKPGAYYELKLDTNGDAREDVTYRVTFGNPNGSGVQSVKVMQLPASGKAATIGTGSTGTAINLNGGGKLIAGLYDDPFFFDLYAFLDDVKHQDLGRDFCDGDTEDFFLGLNVNSIVLELPKTNLASNQVGYWGRTVVNDVQVDRMGRPAINTVFIPSSQKNAYNAGKPRNDARDFSSYLGSFASVLLPDILTVDFSSGSGFLNGRQLANDVIDIELNLVTSGAITTDCVGNDSTFSSSFPYLQAAN
jgi:Domain of unknown function (DUF4331)